MKKKHLLLATLLFLCKMIAQSQSYYARHYQVENGLSNNAVICSLQDRKGFLWFGTKDGLNRFDGYSFKIFRNEPGKQGAIGSNFIHSLYEDEKGVLWVGTESGLYQYHAETESFSQLKDAFDIQIRDIRSDKKGTLWFISGFALCRYVAATKKVESYPVENYFSATSICTTTDGGLWAATDLGLLKKYNPASNSFSTCDLFCHSKQPVSRWIEKIYATSKSTILVGTSTQGAKVYDIATASYKDILTYNADKTELFARNFVQTSEAEFWMATESGIFIYNGTTGRFTNLKKKYNDPYSLSDNAVYTFCTDREGGIWAGTYFGGINYYPKQYTPFKKTFPKLGENSLSGNVVREIRQDDNGNLWIGTEDAGLNMFDTLTGGFTQFVPTGTKGSISYSNIHGLLADGNELWIGTFEHGLDVMNIKTGKVIRHYFNSGKSSLKSNFIYCIYKTTDGDILLGTTVGAYVYDRKRNDFALLEKMPVYNWYTSILKDAQGVLWTGTYGNGVNYLDTKSGSSGNLRHNASDKNSLSSDRVNAIFEDSERNLWFATEDGLCKWNAAAKNFTRYNTSNGFPSNFMMSLLEDDNKRLWISTTKGLVCFQPGTEKLQVFTVANGLLSDQFNFSSAYKDAKGRMYFGSAKGMVSFHPAEFSRTVFPPPVYITGFQINNKDVAVGGDDSPLKNAVTFTDKLTLAYNDATFSIDFAALSYTAPEMLEYAYKMEGLSADWTYLKKNRKVYFTQLAPGTYTFKVKATNSSSTWNNRETTLVIVVLPPWWRSWWAYGIYALAIVLLVVLLVRNYHKRMQARAKRSLELLEIAKEKELYHAKVEFFTNVAHEIRTPLSLIKWPLEKVMKRLSSFPELESSLKIMDRNTSRLIELTNQLLDFRQTEASGFSLSFVRTNVSELLEDVYQSFASAAEQKNLRIAVQLPDEAFHAYVDAEAFRKIIFNLFGNAVKYADSFVEISLLPFWRDNASFTIKLKNDGYLIPRNLKEKIFEPFYRIKETDKEKGTGIGLALARSLAQLHKGELLLRDAEANCNVFALTLPVHQDVEFTLTGVTKRPHSTKDANLK